MTEQIKSAIEWFDDFVGFYSLSEDEKKMSYLAIRSLKAWEEVLQELEHDKEICFAHDSDEGFVYARVIDTINQKLAEIE